MVIAFRGVSPQVDPAAYVHQSAYVVGDVVIGAESSVWFGAIVRGDVHWVRIGKRTNLQDQVIVHVTRGRWPTVIGDDVTIAHGAILHGCSVGDRCLIGIGAIVLDGAVIGSDCLIAAGSLVTPGTAIPSGHLAMGSPARPARPLRDEEIAFLRQSAANYVEYAAQYRAAGI